MMQFSQHINKIIKIRFTLLPISILTSQMQGDQVATITQLK